MPTMLFQCTTMIKDIIQKVFEQGFGIYCTHISLTHAALLKIAVLRIIKYQLPKNKTTKVALNNTYLKTIRVSVVFLSVTEPSDVLWNFIL